MEDKAKQEARWAQQALDKHRSRLSSRGEMDGMARGIASIFKLHESAGLPNAEENESYDCIHCGTRVYRKQLNALGKSIYVFPACKCVIEAGEREREMRERVQRRNQLERIYNQNLMSERLLVARFENFLSRRGAENAFRQAKVFADNFEDREAGVLLWGNPGNGKSHLCAAVHHQLESEGHVCLFLEVERLLELIEDAKRFSSKVNINDIINGAITCDLLTLDELGVGKLTQDAYKALATIINGRQGKLTNYTSNLNLDELNEWFRTDHYGKVLDNKGRMIDRLIGSCVIVENTATSKRQEDAMNRMGQ